MPNVDPVILQLKAEIADYQRDLTKAQRLTDDKLDAIERRGFQMGQSLKKGFDLAKGAAIAFAGSMAADKIMQAITTGLEYASSLGEVAQQLGVTTDALQEYRYAATQVGLSAEEMDQALSQLTRRAGEAASGTKAQAEAFEKLGISVKDANGALVPTGELIPMIADAISRIEDPAARAAIEMDLFGRAGQKLEPLLAGGSAAVNQLRDAAHELGIVLSEDQIQRADDTADKLAAVKTVLEANIASAVANNSGAILALANAMATLVTWAGKAAEAFTRFKMAQGIAQEEAKLSSWFTSDQGKVDAIRKIDRYKAELARLNGTQDKSGSFRDYRAAPLDGYDPNKKGGSVAPGVPMPKIGGGKASAAGGGGGGYSGPSAAEIQNRLDGQLASYAQQAISAMQSVAKSADERAELELRSVELSRVRTIAEIDADKNYTEAQKARLRQQVEALADAERERVEFQRKAQAERDAADIADAEYRAKVDGLRAEIDLTDSNATRRDLSFELLDLEIRYQRSMLERVLASETAADVDKKRAQIALDALNKSEGARREAVARDNETPGQRYARELRRDAVNVNDAIESIQVDGLKKLNDGLVDAIMGTKSLGDVFKNVANQIVADLIRIGIQKAIIGPLANALFGGGSGGAVSKASGFIGSAIKAVTGRASGGYVNPGQLYRVNEGSSPGNVEAFIPNGGGQIVPLGQMNALMQPGSGGGGGVVRIVVEEAEGFASRVTDISASTAIEVHRVTLPGTLEAAAAHTLGKAGRPKL